MSKQPLSGADIKAERARYGVVQSDIVPRIPRITRWTVGQIEDDVIELSQTQYRDIIDIIRAIGREKSELKRIKNASER